jgi:nucleotide-binding universal stress UspA family protein
MNTIIATTDYTRESRTAVNYAARLAMIMKAELLLLHATYIPVVSDSFIDISSTLDEIADNDKERMTELVKHVSSKMGPALKIRGNSEIGLTGELLKEYISKDPETIVVMGMKHVDKFSEVVFGSTATNLAGELPCPILVIPPDARFRPWKKIAFAFDQKEIPVHTGLKLLKQMSEKFAPKVHYVHVMDTPYSAKELGTIKHVQNMLGSESQVHFLTDIPGETTEVLNDWVRRFKSNLVVMVARKHNIFWKLIYPSHTLQLAFKSSVPVLIISED